MAHLNINTSQNVQIQYSTADVGRRILSQILDYIFLGTYIAITVYALNKSNFDSGFYVKFLLTMLPVIFYSFITESIFQGQSFGKMIVKIKVIKLDGSQASLLNYFIRWIFRIVDISIGYGVIAIITVAASKHNQRVGDMLAGTVVINLKKKQSFKHSIYQQLPEDYKLQYPQVELLADEDIQTVNEVLNRYRQYQTVRTKEMMSKTVNAIQSKIGVETTEQSDFEFLKTIIDDYNYVLRNDDY